MTELIVALDLPTALEARGLFNQLMRETEVKWFKVGRRILLSNGAHALCETIVDHANLFLDLKIYDTADTVEADACRAFALGARFLTVHATPSMLIAAMRAKLSDNNNVLAVNRLTDEGGQGPFPPIELVDGIICSVPTAHWFHNNYKTEKLLICPGIRLIGINPDNHVDPATPAER